jgi:transposase
MKKRTSAAAVVLEDNTITILELDARGVNASAIAKIYDVSAPTVRAFIARKVAENLINDNLLKDN